VYSRLEVTAGQSVELVCNASLRTDIMWTYDTQGSYVDYVYWKSHIASNRPRLALKTTGGDHSLLISDVKLNDSGLYNCYDDNGLRKVGYQLVVKGKSCTVLALYHIKRQHHALKYTVEMVIFNLIQNRNS